MSTTRLDTHTALVVIDLQKGIVALPTAHRAGRNCRRARIRSRPTGPSSCPN